jgi:hypothetical protein
VHAGTAGKQPREFAVTHHFIKTHAHPGIWSKFGRIFVAAVARGSSGFVMFIPLFASYLAAAAGTAALGIE